MNDSTSKALLMAGQCIILMSAPGAEETRPRRTPHGAVDNA